MKFSFKHPTEFQQGVFLLVAGVFVLLYAFNFFQQWLNVMVITGGFIMVLYGFIKVGGIELLKKFVKKNKD